MVKCDVKIRDGNFRRSFARFAANSKRAKQKLMLHQARLFVRDVVRITPPNKNGKMDPQSGRIAIAKDLRHIFNPLSPALYRQAVALGGSLIRREQRRKDGTVWLTDRDVVVPDARSFHQSQRLRNGRTTWAGRRTRDIGRHTAHTRGIILKSNFSAYLKSVQARIGILASGWNAAANRLGLRLPNWITRHGTRFGRCSISTTARSMTIRIVNAVRFAGDVRGLTRRVQWAVDNRARQMDKQLDEYAIKREARAAGLKVR